ncbi:MAG: hypothetical protein ABJI69_10045 [Balneola sp.]
MMRFYHITLWYRYNVGKNRYEFNHLEYGWNFLSKPIPMFPAQKNWNNHQWMREHTVMDVRSKAVA